MFDTIYKLLKVAMLDAIPAEYRNIVTFDAVDRDATPKAGRQFAITIENTEAQQMSVGRNPRFQVDGSVMLRMYEPSGAGEGDQAKIGTQIALTLTGKGLKEGTTSVILQTASLLNSGRSGPHWERIVRAPFKATFYKTS